MACYYLVISSTHLSNGHFRSIKGVFRGPLCKNGSETLDYAEKEKAIAKALEDLKANFYCELCDKQYHKHQEFDNHINSYDHAHKQRLKELKQREFARNVASRSRKDEKKQEKALRRLHQLAELRRASECASGSGPMFKPTTVAVENQLKQGAASAATGRDGNGRKNNSLISFKKEQTTKKSLENNLQCPHCSNHCVHVRSAAQIQGKLSLKPFSLFTNRGSSCLPTHKASVSFSFSKKAPLKLESSASVFNDTIEETNHGDELHCHTGKAAFEAEMSEIPSGINTTLERNEARQSPVDSGTVSNPFARVRKLKALMLKENKDEAEKEYYCYTPTHYKPKTNFPFLFFMKSSEKADASKLVAQDSKAKVSQTAGSELRCTKVPESRDEKHEDADSKKMSVSLSHLSATQQAAKQEEVGIVHQESSKIQGKESSECKAGESDYTPPDNGKVSSVRLSDGPKQITEPFLPVLSRDEATLLQWPSELLLFTKAEPSLSYSCNPLYFEFKLSRNKNRENGASGQEADKEGEQNVNTAVPDMTGAATAKEGNGSLDTDGAPHQEEQPTMEKSKKRKNGKKSSKKSKRKSKPGEIQAENINKRKRGKKHKHKHKDNTEKEGASPLKVSISGVVEQLCEETFKEERYPVLSQKRALQNELSHNSDALEQNSNSETCSCLKARNKRQKRSPCNSLSHSKEGCEDQKEPRSRLNLNSDGTENTEESHRKHHKSSSHHSYEDDSESDTSICRKSRYYSSSHDSSFKSSSDSYSDTSSDRSRTSHSSRSYSDKSSDYSNRSRSRRYSKRHHELHQDYKYHSRHKKKRHSDSSASSQSSNDDRYYQRRNDSRSRNRGSAQTRPYKHTRGRTHSRSWNRSSGEERSHSRSRSRYRSRSRQSRSRQQSSSKDYLSSRRHSLRRSGSRNTEEHSYERLSDRQSRRRSSRSFSRERVYHIRSPHYNINQGAMRASGRQYGTREKEDAGQNYSTTAANIIQKHESGPCSSIPLKERTQEKQNCLTARNLLEKVQYKKMEEKSIVMEELASVSNKLGIKLKDPPQGYFGPRLPPSLGNVTLLPLIGKLPVTKRVGVKKDDTGKDDNSEKIDEPEHSENNGNGIALTIVQEGKLYPKELSKDEREAEADTMCTEIQSTQEEQADPAMYQVQSGEEDITPATEEMSSVVSSTGDIFIDNPQEVKVGNPQMAFYDCDIMSTDPVGDVQFGYYNTDVQSIEETEPQHKQHFKSISPPLSAQPIIFTPEEMEKYGKLQLQAQQHIQQQFLAKQVKTFPSSAAITFTPPPPAIQPVSIQQPSSTATSITTVHHTLLQHRAAATLAAALHPNAHHQPMAQLHHIAQPHITPFSFSPIAHTIFPAHPAAFLAGHPLHFIPAAAIHPAHLTLHPLPHTGLYPTFFAPHPAAAAASTIHLHPLLHPLISGHDLQHHSGPNT